MSIDRVLVRCLLPLRPPPLHHRPQISEEDAAKLEGRNAPVVGIVTVSARSSIIRVFSSSLRLLLLLPCPHHLLGRSTKGLGLAIRCLAAGTISAITLTILLREALNNKVLSL